MENKSLETKMTPKDFFLNLGWVITLYGSIVSLLNLFFEIVDRLFPDVLSYGYYSHSIRLSIAWLIVLFPSYVFITSYINKLFVVDRTKRDLRVRKWFIFLTLFLSLSTILVDVVFTINNFLSGELTARFLYKALATLVVAALVFSYYFMDLRSDIGLKGKKGFAFATAASFIVLASLVFAFSVIGSPTTERARRLDEQRANDLQDLQWRIINYWQMKGKLPASLDDLKNDLSNAFLPLDPETRNPYEYRVLDTLSFELCAVFKLASNTEGSGRYFNTPRFQGDYFTHPAGKFCFQKTIDTEFYPKNKRP